LQVNEHGKVAARLGRWVVLLVFFPVLSACPHDLRRFWLSSADGGGGAGDAAPSWQDTSAPTADRGQQPGDKGSPPVDHGLPAADKGSIPVDTGLPAVDKATTNVDKGSTSPDTGTATPDKGLTPADAGPPPTCKPCTGQGIYCNMECTYKGGKGTLGCTGFGSLFLCACVGKCGQQNCWSGTVPHFGCDVCTKNALKEPKCLTLLANDCCP